MCRDCHQHSSAVSRRCRAVSRTTTTTRSLATRPHARQQSAPGTLDAVSTAGCAVAYVSSRSNLANTCYLLTYLLTYYYFASAAVAVDSSHMTASSSASWSRFRLPSNVVNGHVSTMWFMVCRWPQSQEDTIRYDTIRDAILTCARKPT